MGITELSRSLVAVIDSADVTPAIRELCLGEREALDASTIANPRRRDEWVAGRIAAKFVFLFEARNCGRQRSGEMHLRSVGSRELSVFGADEYRSVSVVRSEAPGGGPSRVGWVTSAERVNAAISHSAGIACASVSTRGVCSLDLETPAPRVPEFYRQTFTRRECEWVSESSTGFGLNAEWLYTLLWSARECLLKTPQFMAQSLWNMPELEIGIKGSAARLAAIYKSIDFNGSFESFEASSFRGPFRLEVAGNHKHILTSIRELD